MDAFWQLLGRFHPVVVHLPIGIFLLLAMVEVAGLWPRAPRLAPGVRTLVLGLGLVLSLATSLFGWLLAREGGYDPVLLERHRWLGLGFVAAAAALLLVRSRPVLYGTVLGVTVALLAAAGHFGGSLTHGVDYLRPAVTARRPIFSDPAQAQVFSDLVHPILEQRCAACHGATKHNGDLRLDSFELLAQGGKTGPAFQPGDVAGSLMLQRIHLPLEAKEHMPPAGKPQLTDEEVTLLEWWIEAGAPQGQRLAEVAVPPLVAEIVAARLGVPAAPPPDRAAMLAAAARLERELGILVRPLAADAPWLEANARLQGTKFGDAQLAALAPIAPALRWLDLGETAVTDAGLGALGPMNQLRRLHLDRTAITDAGLNRLSPLVQLEMLNLRGTAVTDAGLEALRALPRLRSLYLWQTAVTPAAAKVFAEAQTDARRIARWRAEVGAIESRIRAENVVVSLGEATLPMAPPPAATPARPPEAAGEKGP